MILHVSCDWCEVFPPKTFWAFGYVVLAFQDSTGSHIGGIGWDRFPHLPPRVVTLTPAKIVILARRHCRSPRLQASYARSHVGRLPSDRTDWKLSARWYDTNGGSFLRQILVTFLRWLPHTKNPLASTSERHARPTQTKTTFGCSKLQLYRKVSGKSWNFVWPCFPSRQILGLPPVPVIVV